MENVKKGGVVSAVGIALNFMLASFKIAIGFLCGLISVVADGVNNLSDCGSGVVLLVSVRISQKPADKEHPYGHQRAEYVASLLIGCIIVVFAAELLRESIEKCVSGTLTEGNLWLYLILGISVLVKAGMAIMYRIAAAKFSFSPLSAAATDSLVDCIATAVVAAGAAVTRFASFPADGYAGILVALFIAFEGISVLREAGSALLGRAPDKNLVERMKQLILSSDGVIGMHDLRVYRYGPEKYFATAHVETDAGVSVFATHEAIDALEMKIEKETGVTFTAHCDPVALDDEEATELEARIRAAVTGMFKDMNLHDFRLVRGVRKKIIFDVGVPFECAADDQKIKNDLERAVKLLTDTEAVVTVDRE